MNILSSVVFTIHVFAALGVILLVLMQHGKGADVGASFGGGASGSIFGSAGSANFLSRTTAILATIFFITSLTMAYLNAQAPAPTSGGLMEGYQQTTPSKPAVPASDPTKPALDASGNAAIPAPTAKPAETAKPEQQKKAKSDAIPN